MIPALEKYYLDRFELFTTSGWKALIEDLEEMKLATDRIGGINTAEELHYKKGELSIINWMLGLAAMSENAYIDLQNEVES